jgi:hypothetical protein
MTYIEYLIIAAILAIVGALFVGATCSRDKFEAACAKSGGETVYDGRQYQCLNAKGKQ